RHDRRAPQTPQRDRPTLRRRLPAALPTGPRSPARRRAHRGAPRPARVRLLARLLLPGQQERGRRPDRRGLQGVPDQARELPTRHPERRAGARVPIHRRRDGRGGRVRGPEFHTDDPGGDARQVRRGHGPRAPPRARGEVRTGGVGQHRARAPLDHGGARGALQPERGAGGPALQDAPVLRRAGAVPPHRARELQRQRRRAEPTPRAPQGVDGLPRGVPRRGRPARPAGAADRRDAARVQLGSDRRNFGAAPYAAFPPRGAITMAGYIRRFSFDPGQDVLLNIESIKILDLQPPSSLSGVGSGTAQMVGEFENGPYNFALEIDDFVDYQRQFGTLGYTYNGVQAQNPCAIARRADGAALPEFWNGNASVQVNGKQFSRLLLVRVNTSVGSVQFTKLPYVGGSVAALSYPLVSGAALSMDLGAGPATATFTGTPATVAGSGAAFGRINQFAGFALATLVTGQVNLTGVQAGTGGSVRVVSGTTGALAALGLTVGTTTGAGNVANIGSVSQNEVQAVVQAGIANSGVSWDSQSRIRLVNKAPGTAPFIRVNEASTASLLSAFGLTAPQVATQQGQALVVGGALTLTLATSDTVTLGIDAFPNVVVTFASSDNTAALICTK